MTIKKKFVITDSNHIVIDCKVNDVDGKFIIDSGASNSCINYSLVKKFNLFFNKYDENASSATGEINQIFYSKNNTLRIANFHTKDFEVILFDMTHINKSFY